jgi:hypothetical protein
MVAAGETFYFIESFMIVVVDGWFASTLHASIETLEVF